MQIKTKRAMIVEGLLRNIRSNVVTRQAKGRTGVVFYVEPEYQEEIQEVLKDEGYDVSRVAVYELKVRWDLSKKIERKTVV